MGNIKNYSAWLSSFRLRTLPLAISTISVANALAYWQNHFNVTIYILTLATAICLQIISNVANDYGDYVNKADTESRVGPLRGIHTGHITLGQLKKLLYLVIVITIFLGLLLLFFAIQNITELYYFIGLGASSIIAAITYTVGKRPYGYIGLGDLSVLLFFGFVGIIGSYYLQTNTFELWLIAPSFMIGLLSVGALNINNMRDYNEDIKVGKRTLVVVIGLKWARIYHITILILSLFILATFIIRYLNLFDLRVMIVLIPLYLLHICHLEVKNPDFKRLLPEVVRLNVITATLFIMVLL